MLLVVLTWGWYSAGVPNPTGHRPLVVHGLLGTGPHSRRWAAGERVKLHLYLQPLPITCITAWALPPVRSAAALDSYRSSNPAVNCSCEGSRLRAPYANLIPDDLRWSWGCDASAGERLQIQIIISREVWLHRDCNKSIACRLISKSYQWVTSENKLRAPTDSALRWVVQLFHYILQCNNGNKVHNKCNVLESSQNHPPPTQPPAPVRGKIVFHETSPGAKKVGDPWYSVIPIGKVFRILGGCFFF